VGVGAGFAISQLIAWLRVVDDCDGQFDSAGVPGFDFGGIDFRDNPR